MVTTLAAAPTSERGSAVSRTMAVLNAVRRPGSHGPIDVAACAGLPVSTTHRYLQALVREGRVRKCEEPKGHYVACADAAPSGALGALEELPLRVPGRTPPAVRAALSSLQARTGQIVLLHSLVGMPMMRLCTRRLLGGHGRDLLVTPVGRRDMLWGAALDTDPDASGLVIRACLDELGDPMLREIRRQGFASERSPLPGWHSTAAPLWRSTTVVGSVAVLSPGGRETHVYSVMDTAGVISGYLTRTANRNAG
ncbi:helix-turn-helix domain-containing protein [Streptomyces sp. NPDC046977]|uniref:helix-turn-helix domain-containing protein n=1 Tax=Streptomyces sp. NPDC046977 TaxID=3154703 RepID=UPI003403DFB6